MRRNIQEDDVKERMDEMEVLYPREKGYYHSLARLNPGSTMTEDEAKALFKFTFRVQVPDPVFKHVEITEEYALVVGIDSSKDLDNED